jgi:P-type conjugative transfer protein TrbJ
MRRHSLFISIFLVLAVCVNAYAGAGDYATEPTQLLNYAELINQYEKEVGQYEKQVLMVENQLQQLANMATNTQGFSNTIWGNAMQDLALLQQAVAKGQALAYTFSNMDQVFEQRFKGYSNWSTSAMGTVNFPTQYANWSQQTLDTCRSALSAANLQYQNFTTEQGTMHQLVNASQSATGRMQAIQVGNQIAAQLVDQMQKLRQLLMTQIQMQAQYISKKQDQDDLNAALFQNYFQPPTLQLGTGQTYGPGDIH